MNTTFSKTIGFMLLLLIVLAACAAPELMAETPAQNSGETAVSLPTTIPQSLTTISDPDLVLTPAALTAPAVGGSVVDPTFGTTLRRLTNTGSSGFATHIYSQLQAFSADNQYILLIEDEWYTVRRRDNLALLLDASDTASWNAPRWHPTQANTIIHFDDNADTTLRVQFTDVTTGQTTTEFTFPSPYERIRSNQSFDEISQDGRYLAGMASLSGGDQMLFTLNIQTGTLGAELRLSADLYGGPCAPDPDWGEVEPDWIGVSPLSRYMMVQWTRDGTERCSGLETFDITTGAFVGRVYDGHQHGDLGVMADGTTEFFMTYELYHPSGDMALGYRTLPGNATVQDPVYIRTMDWIGDHISCKGPNGVCLITTISDTSNGWQPLEGELFLQYLDGSVERLVHHRSSGCGYWVQPRASMSRDGRFVIFATDWGSGICSSPVDLGAGDPYLIDLGSSGPPPGFTPTSFTYLPTVSNNAQSNPPTATPVSGGGNFTQQPVDTAVHHGQHVNVVDLDKDGDEDIILSLSLDDAINLYRNDGNGNFTVSQIAPNDTIVAMETAVTDMDNDGDLDVAAVGLFDRGPCGWGSGAFCEAPGVVVWYENPGSITGGWTRHDIATNMWGARTITTADLTGNGLPDVIVGAVTLFGHEDGLYWFGHNSNGDSWTGAKTLNAVWGNVQSVLSHDVDGDGVADVVAVSGDSSAMAWFENGRASGTTNANPTFNQHAIANLNNPYGLVLANMDGDAALELIVTSNDGTIWYDPPANPASTWTANTIDVSFGMGNNARPAAADFDGDGDMDVAVSSSADAALRWYEYDGSWSSHPISSYSGVTGFASSDINGDGKPDLISTTYANDAGSDRLDWWLNQ